MIHDENGGKIPIYHFMCVKYAEYLASPLTLHLSLCSRMRKNNFSVRISHTQCFIALSPQLMASPFVATLPFPATALVDCIPTARRPLAAAGAATGGAAQAQSPLLLQSTTTTTTTASQKERERERRGGGGKDSPPTTTSVRIRRKSLCATAFPGSPKLHCWCCTRTPRILGSGADIMR